MKKYAKTISSVVTGLIGWATVVITSVEPAITASEWLMLATVVATSLGVYQVRNATE